MPIDYSKLWQTQENAYQEALVYIHQRMKGEITSMKTPWRRVNESGVDGLEWNSMTVIGGRPGTGKTLVKDQIIRSIPIFNPGESIHSIDFSFEMVNRAAKVREFCAAIGKPYKYICSAGDGYQLTLGDFDRLKLYAQTANRQKNYPIVIVDQACTLDTFEKIIDAYMRKHAKRVRVKVVNKDTQEFEYRDKVVYPNTVIGIDHSYLFKMSKIHKSKTDMLYDLGERLTKKKRQYPIAFIILSQLKREAELAERNEDGKYGNYILQSDILGGDALMQHADMCIGLNRPADRNIKFYGPDRYIINDDSDLILHFLKTRTGDTGIAFFRAHYHKMEITEGPMLATGGLSTI